MVSIDRIYVINLKRRKARKDRISSLLLEEALGIPINITEAFDFGCIDINLLSHWLLEQNYGIYPNWKTTKSKKFESYDFSSWDNREITNAEIGCALSHMNVWKKIKSNQETALILEDDAFWHAGKLKKFITESLPKCPKTDILYLGRNKASGKEEESVDEDGLFVDPAFSYNAHAYIMGNKTASKLLSTKIFKNLVTPDEFLVACWTKHRREDFSKVFPPIIKALSSNLEKFEIWQQSFPGGYFSDIEKRTPYGTVSDKKIYCFTVADDPTNEGLEKHICTSSYNQVPVKILGLDSPWGGGDMVYDPGGGQKINLLIPEVEKLKDDPNAIVLFVDGYDILFLGSLEEIVYRFLSKKVPVLFGAEKSCWPDGSLSQEYPDSPSEYKFLNSGNIIGYAKDLHNILDKAKREKLPNISDDQLYYTLEFLRGEYKNLISLDYQCEIFQCLGSSYDDVEVENGKLYNKTTNTRPLIAHGNSTKEKFWYLSNYLTKEWNSNSPFSPSGVIKDDPIVYISIHCVSDPLKADWENFFRHIRNIDFPKRNIILHINDYKGRLESVQTSVDTKAYQDVLYTHTEVDDHSNRNLQLSKSVSYSYDYYFYIEDICLLKNPKILNELIKTNKNLVSPVLREIVDNKDLGSWDNTKSNFWGALNKNGYYKQSDNYFDILNRKQQKHKKCWAVPFVGSCYLIKRKVIENNPNPYGVHEDLDMSIMKKLRYKRVLFHADNRHDYGIINWKY